MSNQKTIIKKVKKHGGGGHHGGSWKVAYADFVTAMMAFFLLMWLLNMSSPEKRARLAEYFKHFSIYSSGGTSFMAKSSEMFSESGQNPEKVFSEQYVDNNADKKAREELQVIEKSLKKGIAERLGDLKDQVLVDEVQDGIRIQMIDKHGSLMFERGSHKLTKKAKEVLRVIGDNINDIPNKVIIEGHTDALPYEGSDYSNWELSTERASSARKELETNGLDPQRIAQVAGYADTDPFIKENPADPRNRRISIILKLPGKNRKNINKGKPSNNIEEIDFTTKKSKLTPLIRRDKKPRPTKKSNNNTANNKNKNEWGPIMGKDTWNPVIQKDAWSPVKNKN